jgi:hypothetical protein
LGDVKNGDISHDPCLKIRKYDLFF